jgi:hypothetical protein
MALDRLDLQQSSMPGAIEPEQCGALMIPACREHVRGLRDDGFGRKENAAKMSEPLDGRRMVAVCAID